MSSALQLARNRPGRVELRQPDGRPLFCYVVQPDTPAAESPRPYLHPVYSIDGDVLTNFRPNDHPWHHGLSLTLTSVDGTNFWGGPSHRAEEGYRWRDDHGRQVHREWIRQEPDCLEHVVEWRDARQSVLLREKRTLRPSLAEHSWSLRWTSELTNVADRELTCHNYHSAGGLAGSHYTGLQFRGARGLLDDHGDETIAILGAAGANGEAAVHGQAGRWLEWRTQHDTTLRRTCIRFEVTTDPVWWFVRRALPLVAFSLHRDQPLVLPAGVSRVIDHHLLFARA